MSTQTLSAGRPGAGSAVVTDAAAPLTVNVCGVGVVQTGTSGGGGGGTTQTARVMVLA
jgi:hypothetical protein